MAMKKEGEARKRETSDEVLSRLPYLRQPLLQFNLPQEIRQLRQQDSWQRETGRSSRTLAKYQDFRIVLVLMKAGSLMKEHHADGRISVHLLQGKVRLHLPDQKIELSTAELMVLDHRIRHDVEALEESAFLLTISWPGGTLEERHAI